MLPPGLAGAAHDQEIAGAGPQIDGTASPVGPEEEGPRRTHGQDRHQRVVEVAKFPVGVEGDAVAAIPVVVEPHGCEEDPIAAGHGRAELHQGGVGQVDTGLVPPGESGLVDHPVVHPAPALAPCHLASELFEEAVAPTQPVACDLDPRAAPEVGVLERGFQSRLCRSGGEETGLSDDHDHQDRRTHVRHGSDWTSI